MFVLINGKKYDSNKTPIMIMFSKDEMTSFKSQPDNVDMHCSFPPSWGSAKGQKWMHENKHLLIGGKSVNDTVSDEAIKKLLSEEGDGIQFVDLFGEDGDGQ